MSEDKKIEALELGADELDQINGGAMNISLYKEAMQKTDKLTGVKKQQARIYINHMRSAREKYLIKDVEELLNGYGLSLHDDEIKDRFQ